MLKHTNNFLRIKGSSACFTTVLVLFASVSFSKISEYRHIRTTKPQNFKSRHNLSTFITYKPVLLRHLHEVASLHFRFREILRIIFTNRFVNVGALK